MLVISRGFGAFCVWVSVVFTLDYLIGVRCLIVYIGLVIWAFLVLLWALVGSLGYLTCDGLFVIFVC